MTTIDPLIVDAYQLDGAKDWKALAAAGLPWIGARLKATQGTYYSAPSWFPGQLAELAMVATERNGVDWFFGAYHYLDIALDGEAQADFFLRQLSPVFMAKWDVPGLLPAMVDVERGGQRAPTLTRSRVEDVTNTFAARVLAVTGRAPTLYGGELLASLGITSHMGCSRLSIARYAPTLPHDVVTRIGWDAPDEWQFCGDGEAYLPGYPTTAPGCGKIDISVLTSPGGVAAFAAALKS